MNAPEVYQTDDGKWAVRYVKGGVVKELTGYIHVESARLVAYQLVTPTPLRSYRKGGGYVRA